MTIISDENIVYKNIQDRISVAKIELGMASDVTHQIYQSRQLESRWNKFG